MTATVAYATLEAQILAALDKAVQRAEKLEAGPYRRGEPERALHQALSDAANAIARVRTLHRTGRLPDADIARLERLEGQYHRIHQWAHTLMRHQRRAVDAPAETLANLAHLKSDIEAFSLGEPL